MTYALDSVCPCRTAEGTLHPPLGYGLNSDIADSPMADTRMKISAMTMTMWTLTFKF
jgi:hypothetical protein